MGTMSMAIRLHLYRRGAEKEGEPAEQTEADGKDGKSQTSCCQVRIVENRRAGKACKSEHFGVAAIGIKNRILLFWAPHSWSKYSRKKVVKVKSMRGITSRAP